MPVAVTAKAVAIWTKRLREFKGLKVQEFKVFLALGPEPKTLKQLNS